MYCCPGSDVYVTNVIISSPPPQPLTIVTVY
jgi:hypothetical protein